MILEVHNRCSDYNTYRAARVKSLFNAEKGCNFDLVADLPIDDMDWKIGLIVGPSGSGKTSMGKKIFPDGNFYEPTGWSDDKPIVDDIAPDGDFNEVTAALAAVGLGDVPTWLRPYAVLSNGQKFRADLAKIIAEKPKQVVVDEFTSVVDRQIAKFGATAFSKSWKRNGGQCVLLSCHYDIVDWVEPDWVFDTSTGEYAGRCLWRRPKFELQIWKTDSSYWGAFEPHHYLKMPKMVCATYYVGVVDGVKVCHIATAPRLDCDASRASRLVVMPEWQGAGVGLRFLNWVCNHEAEGKGRFGSRVKSVLFHTSHPGLVAALRRDKKWVQVSASLFGGNKAKSKKTIVSSTGSGSGYGGHFRSVQGFRYVGDAK